MLSTRFAGTGSVRLANIAVATLLLALAFATVHDTPAHAAGTTKVVGTFKYKDTDPNTGVQTDRPIAGAKVEIWRFRNRIWPGIWAWGKDAETRTDASGNISADVPFSENGVVYGLRVFASNDAAVVWPNDLVHTTPFFREPGKDDNAEILRKETAAGQTLDFSYTFHGWSSQHFNVADVARHGKAFADARRDPSETDPLPPASFQPQDSPTTSYYNPVNDTVNIDNPHVDEDLVILHEYAHYVEDQVSKFAPIPAFHTGCTATLGPFNITGAEHAWMEGFADYYAQAVARSSPPGSLTGTPGRGTPSANTLENPSCAGLPTAAIPGDAVEHFVAGTLWDLSDRPGDPGSLSEGHDVPERRDTEIFQIFDRELDATGADPTITHFRDSWVRRGLPAGQLSDIMIKLEVPLRTNFGPTANAGPNQWVDEGTLVRLDGGASSDPERNSLNYSWTQVGGPAVNISNPSSATPTFSAPQVASGSTTLAFRLTVNDGIAPPSAPDDVSIQVFDVPDFVPPAPPTLDLRATSDSGASATDNITNDATPTLSGKAEAGSTVKVYDGTSLRGTSTADGAGDWSLTTGTLTGGTHLFTATATDASGNVSAASASLRVIVDRTAPVVAAVAPAHLAKNVSPATNVAVTFSEGMSKATLNKATVKLVKKGTITPVAATVTFAPDGKRAVLNPTRNLAPGAAYTATVTTGAKDLAGNPLAQKKVSTFTVKK